MPMLGLGSCYKTDIYAVFNQEKKLWWTCKHPKQIFTEPNEWCPQAAWSFKMF